MKLFHFKLYSVDDSHGFADDKEEEEEDEDSECDDLCDICMSSGVCIEFTTSDGRTVCVDCAVDFEEEEEDE